MAYTEKDYLRVIIKNQYVIMKKLFAESEHRSEELEERITDMESKLLWLLPKVEEGKSDG